jgi:prepilin-type processing-associated H-X9-DG protein
VKNVGIFVCPSGPKTANVWPNFTVAAYYGLPMLHILPEGQSGALSMARFKRPADLFMLMEGNFYTHYCPTCHTTQAPCGTGQCIDANCPDVDIHNEGANYAYWDGHVKWQKQQNVTSNGDPWGHNGL